MWCKQACLRKNNHHFSIIFNDAIESLLRTNPNYKLIDELNALRRLTRIHTPAEQKRCSVLLSICANMLKDTDYKIERTLQLGVDSIFTSSFGSDINQATIEKIKSIFTSASLHSIVRCYNELDHVRCGSSQCIMFCVVFNINRTVILAVRYCSQTES